MQISIKKYKNKLQVLQNKYSYRINYPIIVAILILPPVLILS